MAAAAAQAQPRVMVLPFPAQGHVIPLMELSRKLVEHGLEIDFVNTEFNHGRVLQALAEDGAIPGGVHMLSIPDGLGPADDHTDIGALVKGLPAAMSGRLEEMIRSRKTNWMIADVSMSWALDLATTVGVRVALFSTYSAAVFALRMNLPKLIEDGVVDESGNVKRHERVQLMPPVDAAEIPWVSLGSTPERRRTNIQNVLRTNRLMPLAETIICNTFMEMEPDALALLPNALPLGPLVAPTSRPAGHFLPEDLTCLAWLDAQAPCSLVYVAFGSSGILDATQFQELADGLALSGRPFLWVVRPNFTTGATEGWLDAFKRRVEGKGLIVGWAPQQRVLSHPAVACFVSHCGWNSTMEGMLHGVPFLCWPYFADQFANQSYVCNVWGTGIKLCRDERGVVTKEEIESKVARLLGDEGVKARAATWKNEACASIEEGGYSHQCLLKLVNLLGEVGSHPITA
ncbi:UDP-glycosyltransferase 83A1-like [Triticum dicoccoides]|uniref:UDP-glycosyltransferase 83A1-like n=1 Tax=Triticum dicoccoides TaxID=85692 RepID=UPI0018909DCA|nr:UDP-glycosyltransferase 83A1-like [Triticum dicoccoides]XP_037470323.1 UDP-glycosyltransferase 83A1-like [Triticum dicoccoides]XP_037470369.1 UDP-glycosyltransferase 83A1-like [Triticum dicoccoides]XP_037471529.1 UDP-glycosyltransferase 83A1-like [Triticum dicoccoides]